MAQQEFLRLFGEHLTFLRGQQNLSVGELARLSKLSPSEVLAVEAGEIDVSLTMLEALATGLGVKTAQLLSFF